MIKTLPEEIQIARIWLVNKRPYIASAMWALLPVARTDKEGLESMAVDQWGRWYINLDNVCKLPKEEISFMLLHEINHLLRHHHSRMQTFGDWFSDSGLSMTNIAGDLEINDGMEEDAKALGMPEIPKSALLPKHYGFENGLLAEEYANKLLQRAKKQNRCIANSSLVGMPNDDNSPSQQPSGGSGKPQQKPGNGSCGSCSGSGHDKSPWEEGAPTGKPGSTPGLSKSEIDVIRRQVAVAVQDHKRTRGTVPGGWDRWADKELEPPKIPWTTELATVIRNARADVVGAVDYSWKRLSRRSTDEILLPGLRKPKVEVAGVIDTSGSMSDADTKAAMQEFAGVLKTVGMGGVKFYSVDAAVSVAKTIWKPSQIELIGGGGTDMRVGIDVAAAGKPTPDVIIVFTDGYTPWPEHPPSKGIKVIAVLVRTECEKPPHWIRSLYVN